jgi:hypothetical protein
VFGALLGLDSAPKFKTKKFSKEDFQDHIGELEASVRYVASSVDEWFSDACAACSYATLTLSSDVNVHWKADEGTFKFSGSYGK